MAGVDFEKDFPQPPKPEPAVVSARRFGFRGERPVEIVLLHPLVSTGADQPPVEIERLTIRRITAEEMIEVTEAIGNDADDATLIRHVTAAMAGVDIDVIGALSPDDAGRVAAAALPFMPVGLVAAIERASEASPPGAQA
jgi:ribosomal protein L12E/L44/L45/RPP1/RPP2